MKFVVAKSEIIAILLSLVFYAAQFLNAPIALYLTLKCTASAYPKLSGKCYNNFASLQTHSYEIQNWNK